MPRDSGMTGEAEPVTEDEYQEAVTIAEQVVQWAENMLSADQA